MRRPIGIPHELARQGDEVAAALGEITFRLRRFGDQTDRHGGNASLMAYAIGERHVIAGHARHHRERQRPLNAAGRAVNNVDAARLELACQHDCIVQRPSASFAVDTGGAEEQRFVLGPSGAGRLDQF